VQVAAKVPAAFLGQLKAASFDGPMDSLPKATNASATISKEDPINLIYLNFYSKVRPCLAVGSSSCMLGHCCCSTLHLHFQLCLLHGAFLPLHAKVT
jgi:hypothetical protein